MNNKINIIEAKSNRNKEIDKKRWELKIDIYKGLMFYVIALTLFNFTLRYITFTNRPDFIIFPVFGFLLALWVKRIPILELIEIYYLIVCLTIIPMIKTNPFNDILFLINAYALDIGLAFLGACIGKLILKCCKFNPMKAKTEFPNCYKNAKKDKNNNVFFKIFPSRLYMTIILNIILGFLTPNLTTSREILVIVPYFFCAGMLLGMFTGKLCLLPIVFTIALQIFWPNNILLDVFLHPIDNFYIFQNYFIYMLCGSETGRRYIFPLIKNHYILKNTIKNKF